MAMTITMHCASWLQGSEILLEVLQMIEDLLVKAQVFLAKLTRLCTLKRFQDNSEDFRDLYPCCRGGGSIFILLSSKEIPFIHYGNLITPRDFRGLRKRDCLPMFLHHLLPLDILPPQSSLFEFLIEDSEPLMEISPPFGSRLFHFLRVGSHQTSGFPTQWNWDILYSSHRCLPFPVPFQWPVPQAHTD